MQPGFFDHQERLDLVERLGDLMPRLQRSVDWEDLHFGCRAAG